VASSRADAPKQAAVSQAVGGTHVNGGQAGGVADEKLVSEEVLYACAKRNWSEGCAHKQKKQSQILFLKKT
jgi:hypothetical protein